MIYLTFGDKYSGIFQSQVIDVLKYVNLINHVNIKLISFVPYPIYKEQKQLIKVQYPNALILPMIPSRNHWVGFHTIIFLVTAFTVLLNKKIVCRGIWSTNIGLLLKRLKLVQWICYDGRGASFAEWNEYLIHNTNLNINKICKAEKKAVLRASYRIAVSKALTEYWEEKYHYASSGNSHSIIPCTIGESFETFINEKDRLQLRSEFGYQAQDVVVVFSGGIDKWQSPELLGKVMGNIIENNKHIKFLFLAKSQIVDHLAIRPFKSLINTFWVKPIEVNKFLTIGDFALLIREKSITNKVASPTKFAEYLACGLEVIITDELGDFTAFVNQHDCGYMYIDKPLLLNKVRTRSELYNLAIKFYSKRAFEIDYKKIYDKTSL